MKRGFLNKPPKSQNSKTPRVSPTAIAADDDPPRSLDPQFAAILNLSYDRPSNELPPFLIPLRIRPTQSEVEARLGPFFEALDASSLIPATVRAVSETWNTYGGGTVAPADFLRSQPGALYRVAKIPRKGRGMLASRDLEVGEVLLAESPLMILPDKRFIVHSFFALPKAAIHALLLLHNTIPNHREYSLESETPQHRLLDYLKGVVTSNAFSEGIDEEGTQAGLVVLAGSLFNHSNKPNASRRFDVSTFKEVFTVDVAVKKGEELTISYNCTSEVLKANYGIDS
ncbi:hypothetical protein DFH06DRAFT_1167913 [Mycena polygramma]|nr:hypothetical protein DFH06DRAFT_1167913 [Mycena polygramma]